MSDERRNCTSASSAEADFLCAGRFLAQQGLPYIPSSPDAEMGNRIHAALAGEQVTLSDDESDYVEKCRKVEDWFLNQIFQQTPEVYREKRYWGTFGEYRHSGKPDVVFIAGEIAGIVDFKSGRNEVESASGNFQLRDLAVLIAKNHPSVKRVYCAIIQPWATFTPEICGYSEADLVIAETEMIARIAASNDPQSKRTPSDKACKYCRAKPHCKEAQETVLAIAKADTINSIKLLDAAGISRFLQAASIAESIIESVKEEAKRRLLAGEAIPNYRLKDGAKREVVTDPQECFNRCHKKGVPLANFMDAVTINKSKLKDAVKLATGSKGKTLDFELAEILSGITEEKESAPSLSKA